MTTTADARTGGAEETPEYYCKGTTGRHRALPEFFNLSARRKLNKVLQEFKPDAVQLLMFLTALSPSILASLRDIPTVLMHLTYREICPSGLRWRPDSGRCTDSVGWSCRDNGCFSTLGIVPRLMQMRLLEKHMNVIDRSVAPSEAMAAILREQGWPVTDTLPFGVPPQNPAGVINKTPLIAFAGRLTKEKGVAWLLDAVAAAGDRLADAKVEIIGDGPYREVLEAKARALCIDDRVDFRGKLSRSDCHRVLSRAWVQVVPSLWPEPFGLVTAESLIRCTPVIVTDQGAPSEMIDHQKTGWTVAVGDVEGLADRLVEATRRDRDTVRTMGQVGAKAAQERYDIELWVDGYIDIYKQLLNKKVPPVSDNQVCG